MTLGALAFLNPWALAALASLPVIYWLLRTVPPRPRQIAFPPTRILVGLENREKTPAKTPWWLMLIRLAAAAFVIFALADPILNPQREAKLAGGGPLAIVVDNGWSGAHRWADRERMLDRLISTAESQSRPVIVLPTAAASKGTTAAIEAPGSARTRARAVLPQPYAPDRAATAEALAATLAQSSATGTSIVWLTDGIDHDGTASAFAERLAGLADSGSFVVFDAASGAEPLGLTATVGAGGKLEARVVRSGGPAAIGSVVALSARGEPLGEAAFELAAGARSADVSFELPLELRNQVTRVALAGQQSAGAVSLLDQRSQWQRVGLVSGETQEQAQPLLAPLYYIEKAIAPTAEIVKPQSANLAIAIDETIGQKVSLLVLADIGTITEEAREQVAEWVGKGGVLVRFAGPRLEKGGDELLPVPLRIGGRTLGGALSWSTPQTLAAFEDQSLFAGIPVPEDVTVSRQVLADPARLGPDVEVWARLGDGTPLVTASRRGDGMIVLFHITANADWSNLPISGLFVDMLKRVVSLGRLGGTGTGEATAAGAGGQTGSAADGALPPVQTLDGFGALSAPPPTARALPSAGFDDARPSLDHPPGYYGARGTPRALNVVQAGDELSPLPALPSAAQRRGYENAEAEPLKPWLLGAALALILLDMIAVLILQWSGRGFAGLFGRRGPATRPAAVALAVAATGAIALLAALAWTGPVEARPLSGDAKAQQATGQVTLGYVVTGDREVDETSRIGLTGLSRVLTIRTAVTPGDPLPVDIVNDEIAFYPLLYWPVTQSATSLDEKTLAKIDAYMKQGGMIVFDTRDQGRGMPTGLPGSGDSTPLQRLLGQLDLPRLEPVPDGHVLTKSFYLLRSFPGRWEGGQLWVEAGGVTEGDGDRQARRADGVSSIIITANDFAAAWALDERGRPLYPTVPGGEVQREMAFRTGINIVMHALTGNYKADQVHVPALLERLGQ